MKPYLLADTPQKIRFNNALTGCRTVSTECIFGILKEKFRVLDNGMSFKLETCRMIGVALCVLYNIALDLGERPVPPPVAEEEGSDEDELAGEELAADAGRKAAGEAYRDSLLRFFSNV